MASSSDPKPQANDVQRKGDRKIRVLKSKSDRKNRNQHIVMLRSTRAEVRVQTSQGSRDWTEKAKDNFKPTKRKVLLSVLLLAVLISVAAFATPDFFALPYSTEEVETFASSIG